MLPGSAGNIILSAAPCSTCVSGGLDNPSRSTTHPIFLNRIKLLLRFYNLIGLLPKDHKLLAVIKFDLNFLCNGGDKGKGGIELSIFDALLAFLFEGARCRLAN